MRRKGARQAGSGLKTSILTWIGLLLVAIGWAGLVGAIVVSDATLRAGSLVATMTLRSDIVSIAQSAIVSGLGLAIVGALRSGFGAFNRFFEAVLQRASTPRPAGPAPADAERVEPAPAPAPGPTAPHVVIPMERSAPPPPPPPLNARERKNYVILADGSVEVETMFGTRIFATLDEAREFIR